MTSRPCGEATALGQVSPAPVLKPRNLIQVPERRSLHPAARLGRGLLGLALAPSYFLLAYWNGVPGLRVRAQSALLAMRLLQKRKGAIPLAEIWRLLMFPMDSVRYFEFDFAWKSLCDQPIRHYLDVSSPRLFPLLMTIKNEGLKADFINPDPRDLCVTENLTKELGLGERCVLHACLIGAVPFDPGSFDAITCISVLEHIPEDQPAIRKMWQLLEPGGRLLLTVPCAAHTFEEFIDRNEYGLLQPNEDGHFFFQRFYDERLLAENVFSVTGEPVRRSVYGEKTPGLYHQNQKRKMSDPGYPAWREPYTMSQDYRYFDNVNQLPGIGVIAMEFVKG